MGMLTEKMQQQLAVLRRQFDKGELSGDELSNQMLQAIETETGKTPEKMNAAWLTACGELMAYADQDKLAQLPDHADQLRWKLAATLHKQQKAKEKRGVYRAALTAACFLLMFFGVTLQGFHLSQSGDEQVYTITGKEVNIGADNHASAAGDDELKVCETADLQELCAFLGYTPQLPTWVPEGWVIDGYFAFDNGVIQEFHVFYKKVGEKYILSYSHTQSSDISALSVDFYQDGAGEYVRLENGLKIYLTTNTGDPVAVWTKSNTYACATGPVSVEEIKRFILSIQ